MRIIATIAAILSFAPQAPGPNPCAGPEYRQFDFWIGDWEVTAPNGTIAGHSHVERIANGCGIEEQWTGRAGGSGRSLNHYGADRRWHQYWVGAGGSVLNLSGTLDGRVMTLGDATNRLSFTNNPDGSVRQQWQTTADGGRTWKTTFDGKYTRAQPAAKPQGVTSSLSSARSLLPSAAPFLRAARSFVRFGASSTSFADSSAQLPHAFVPSVHAFLPSVASFVPSVISFVPSVVSYIPSAHSLVPFADAFVPFAASSLCAVDAFSWSPDSSLRHRHSSV